MIDLDLSTPVNQVRVLIGDINGDYISDSNLQYILDTNDSDVAIAAEKALDYIINVVAYYVREEAGDVEVYWGDIYDKLKDRYDSLIKSNTYKKVTNLFYFGGTTKTEIARVKASSETPSLGYTAKEFTAVADELGIDLDDPYYLRN